MKQCERGDFQAQEIALADAPEYIVATMFHEFVGLDSAFGCEGLSSGDAIDDGLDFATRSTPVSHIEPAL